MYVVVCMYRLQCDCIWMSIHRHDADIHIPGKYINMPHFNLRHDFRATFDMY